jgi:tetratricopeptide (TPR) repeat protein
MSGNRTSYNQADVLFTFSMRKWNVVLPVVKAFILIVLALGIGMRLHGQGMPESAGPGHDRILLVFPFDNRTGQPNLEWIREAAPEILGARFTSAGFAPMSRQDRMYALDHLGLPQQFQPSRASSLKLAQTLDADSIVVGSFRTTGTAIIAEAQVVNVPHLRMSEMVSATGEMRDLIAVFDTLAWRLTKIMDPSFNVAPETFVAAGSGLRLDAFEQYIRGISEPDQQERLRHLKQAVALSPGYGPAWIALGREDFNGQQYEQAAAAFAKVNRNDPDALEAEFYRGLSLMFTGSYAKAEESFREVARVLPLGEVLNNQGVAVSRQNHDGTSLFVQAAAADPNAADYHFNLAVSLKRHGTDVAAMNELTQCLKLRPNDVEAQQLMTQWKAPKTADADEKAEPLERIVRTFDAVAFRQAALMMDQMEASRLAALSPHVRAVKLTGQAKDYLNRGLLLEAERLYQTAVTDDASVAEAHAGLATVRERTGDAAAAREEANTALKLAPSVDAYLVLGRLDLAANHVDDATKEISEALKLDPGSRPAQELNRQIGLRTGKQQ